MATADIRAKRIELEYQSVRGVQDDILDRVDGFEAALLGLNEAVAANQESNERQFAEIKGMLRAIIKDQNVPYKPDMGFLKDTPSNGQG